MEAHVNQRLKEFLQHQPGDKKVRELVPNSPRTIESSIRNYVMGVQVSFYIQVHECEYVSCRGIDLSMSITHKIFDGHTYLLFMKAWAAAARVYKHRIHYNKAIHVRFCGYSFTQGPTSLLLSCSGLSAPRSGPTRMEATLSLIWKPDLPTLMGEIRESIAKVNSDHDESTKGFSRIVALNDTLKAGSVEATVTLKSDEMEIFGHDHELLSYATVDSSSLNINEHSTVIQ
nr:vinorine synthase-like [Tanacetum cinerariifolium]